MSSVGTTPVQIGDDSYLIQNLGPDPLYVGNSDVTTDTGVQINTGESLTVGVTETDVYVVSAGTSDVRTLIRGLGVFDNESSDSGS